MKKRFLFLSLSVFPMLIAMEQPSSSSQPISLSDKNLVITIPEDCFGGQFKKGQEVSPLEILALRKNAQASHIYERYAVWHHRLLSDPNKPLSSNGKLIHLIGEKLHLLTHDGQLVEYKANPGEITKEQFVRFLQFYGLRSTLENGKKLLTLIKEGVSDKNIIQEIAQESLIFNSEIKHPYKGYLQSLYIMIKELRNAHNRLKMFSQEEYAEIEMYMRKLVANGITTIEEIKNICLFISNCSQSMPRHIKKHISNYLSFIIKKTEGYYLYSYNPLTITGQMIKTIQDDETLEKNVKHAIMHEITFRQSEIQCHQVLNAHKKQILIQTQYSLVCATLSVICIGVCTGMFYLSSLAI